LPNSVLIQRAMHELYCVVLMGRNGNQQAQSLDTSVRCTYHAGSTRSSVDVQCFRSRRRRRKKKIGNATGNLQRQWWLLDFSLECPVLLRRLSSRTLNLTFCCNY